MTHAEKIQWMHDYAARNGATLILEGECGFGRECVGILVENKYPDYEWYDGRGGWERVDQNGDVWTPTDAYHKHPCVAVLGRGEEAEAQLYAWLLWFEQNGFAIERGDVANSHSLGNPMITALLGHNRFVRMVRKTEVADVSL